MAKDRDATLKKAEELLRQGKLDEAIEAYVRLVEDQPRDLSSINALGDLYMRAGDVDRAIASFTLVADQLLADGVLPKAAALYKKALKAKGDHEHTLRQLAEIAARQGLLGDSKAYLRQLADLRRLRGDDGGAAESLIRPGTLDEVDADSRIAAARAAQERGDTRRASELLRMAADDLEHQGRRTEALDLLLSLARMELTSEEEHHARATLTRVLTIEPGRHDDVMAIAFDLAKGGRLESAFGCIDVVIDAALLGGDWDRAVEGLQTFVRTVPYVPALIQLVELCVDAGLDVPLREAQAQLADAYLQEGRGAEARVIAEDLLDHESASDDHAHRLLRALELVGVADANQVVEDRRSGRTAVADFSEHVDAGLPEAFEMLQEVEAPPVGIEVPMEIDLSETLDGIDATSSEPDDIAALEAAALVPQTRFNAASELGRLYVGRGDLQAGVEWLERAAEASPPRPQENHAVVYDLAVALARLGENTRALALLIELEAEAGEYRDVRARIEQLGRAQAGSHGR